MHKLYSSKAFQFFAIMIISSLCLLLNSLTTINFHKMELPKTHPQYNAKGISGSVYNQAGKILYNMQSVYAWEYPDDDKIYLTSLKIDMYNESSDLIAYDVTSKDGWINHITKIGHLGESTVVVVANPDPAQVVTMYTKDVDLNMDKNTFTSNAATRAIQGKSSVYSEGFSYDNAKHFLILNSKVRVIYDK